ncbi:50S ribosomal protein L6 [Patescibacteria group bacterium]|nr:50S ribosomal protein L6 [Patescibacteria group bacterium]MBU2579749.1 50S ribosomal protein L6 [Patescibacteria group bacterium]MBU4031035.1 50S ribosomal protein L6 [Patescibacteria group bacterium]MBU4082835.1 50S ribosomal protein L6 [Patescibacteria group bacterium]MCG2809402.1 50S ribosomal protein L6 [Candidatus Portnoybacteria bacterium]
MSRIGKKIIIIPENVEVKFDKGEVVVKGSKGELSQLIPLELEISIKDKELLVTPKRKGKDASALWGLIRSLIANMIQGVSEGFEKQLEINGVGYRVVLEGKTLVLSLGLSHSVKIEAPEKIEFKVEKNIITVSGIDKQAVGQIAAKIRDQKKPEPYKGKGIRYIDEVIRRKSGKKAAGSE